MFISNKKSIDYECNLEHITNCICTWGIEKFVLPLKNLLILVIPSLGTSRKPGRRLLRERVERKALNGQNNRSAFESLVEFSVSLC